MTKFKFEYTQINGLLYQTLKLTGKTSLQLGEIWTAPSELSAWTKTVDGSETDSGRKTGRALLDYKIWNKIILFT